MTLIKHYKDQKKWIFQILESWIHISPYQKNWNWEVVIFVWMLNLQVFGFYSILLHYKIEDFWSFLLFIHFSMRLKWKMWFTNYFQSFKMKSNQICDIFLLDEKKTTFLMENKEIKINDQQSILEINFSCFIKISFVGKIFKFFWHRIWIKITFLKESRTLKDVHRTSKFEQEVFQPIK